MNERQALDRIAALCDDFEQINGHLASAVRAVLAEVSPGEPGGVLDRDQARRYLRTIDVDELASGADGVLDLLAGCVRPAAIDYEELLACLDSAYPGPVAHHEAVADRILTLVRPAPAGVTLTAEAGTATFDDALRDVDDLARVLYEVRESGGWDRAPWADRNYWRGMAAKAIAAGWRHQ